MKKLLALIIAVISLFSISTQTFAQNEPIFERILDLNYGVEDYEIHLANLDEMYFFSSTYKGIHSDFKGANSKIQQEIIQYYREWRFTRSQTQGLVKSHKDFVYYTNQVFRHIKYKELDPNFADVDSAILENYRESRSSYNHIKKIISLIK
jgi:hypothetical protein